MYCQLGDQLQRVVVGYVLCVQVQCVCQVCGFVWLYWCFLWLVVDVVEQGGVYCFQCLVGCGCIGQFGCVYGEGEVVDFGGGYVYVDFGVVQVDWVCYVGWFGGQEYYEMCVVVVGFMLVVVWRVGCQVQVG